MRDSDARAATRLLSSAIMNRRVSGGVEGLRVTVYLTPTSVSLASFAQILPDARGESAGSSLT